jgi:hypothetical protein
LNAVSHDSLQGLEVAALSDIFVIKKIKEQRVVEGRWEYRVEWQGYPGQDTWEPIHNIRGGQTTHLRSSRIVQLVHGRQVGAGGQVGRGRGRGRSRKIAKVQQEDQSEDDEEEDSSD